YLRRTRCAGNWRTSCQERTTSERRRDLRGFSDAASPAVPRSCARVIDLDVSWLVPADLTTIDVLARLQVAAARRRSQLCLHGADGGLAELIDFCGLGDVVQLC